MEFVQAMHFDAPFNYISSLRMQRNLLFWLAIFPSQFKISVSLGDHSATFHSPSILFNWLWAAGKRPWRRHRSFGGPCRHCHTRVSDTWKRETRNSQTKVRLSWAVRNESKFKTPSTAFCRLIYQSRKRGMLENDLLLSTFASKYLKTMTVEQVQQYDTLINKPSNDWDIFYWATNKKPTPPEYDTGVMTLLKEHVKNSQKESRRMPDL